MSPIMVTVLTWFLSPIIRFLLPKIFVCPGFDPSDKLLELEIHIIPELKKTMQTVDQERMMQRVKRVKTDLDALAKMAAMLRHALEDAEDIFDDAQHKIVLRCWHRLFRAFATCRSSICVQTTSALIMQCVRKIMSWSRHKIVLRCCHRLYGAFSACIALCKCCCVSIACVVRTKSVWIMQWVGKIMSCSRWLLRRPEDALPVITSESSSGQWLSCLCDSFDFFKNCCTSLCSWLARVFEAACFYRDWSYQVLGIKKCQENASLFDILDMFLTAISRMKLKKKIQKVENTVTEVKKSPLLGLASNITPDDIANKNRSKIRAASKREVFGREVLRDDIMAMLRETPQGDAPRSSPCYSVIGIYGIAGSGKTTFAGYIRDYINEECKEDKLFDTIMCIHVSETFTVEVIFQEMLKDITGDSHSSISDHGVLNKKLKEELHGKRFFLILDDLWVKNKNDQQLEELISPLNVGLKGSKILVTARTREAAGALCVDELIEMPDLASKLT